MNMESAVLLVDDDESLLQGLASALHNQPFRVYTCRNGEEAIGFLKTREIDVVVADQCMPGMSGVELLAWVAENCPDIMRIVLTGHAEAQTAILAINEAAVHRFFTKPCNEARLALAIHEAIEQRKTLLAGRQELESCRRQLREMERHGQDSEYQNRILSQDIQRPLDRTLECCRRLEEDAGDRLDREAMSLLGEARRAASEARQLATQLQNVAPARTL